VKGGLSYVIVSLAESDHKGGATTLVLHVKVRTLLHQELHHGKVIGGDGEVERCASRESANELSEDLTHMKAKGRNATEGREERNKYRFSSFAPSTNAPSMRHRFAIATLPLLAAKHREAPR
jgi:hypothetical protein